MLLLLDLLSSETFYIPPGRPTAVLAYTAGRLTARMLVVVCAAVMTTNVSAIIWSLIALEALRLLGATIAWQALARSRDEPAVAGIRGEQLKFCGPYGLAFAWAMLSRFGGFQLIASLPDRSHHGLVLRASHPESVWPKLSAGRSSIAVVCVGRRSLVF